MINNKFGWRRDYIGAVADAPSHENPTEKSKDAPAADQPAAEPGPMPAPVTPAPKP